MCFVHHLPEQRFLADEFDVVVDIDQMRNAVEKTGKVADSSCGFELRRADQFLLDCYQIDRLRFFDQLDHFAENKAMAVEVEVFGLEILNNPIIVFVVD